MKTCTIGTVNTSAAEAGSKVRRELPKAARYSLMRMPCSRIVNSETTMKMVPGDQSGWNEALISLPKISGQDQVMKGFAARRKGSSPTCGRRVSTSRPATNK